MELIGNQDARLLMDIPANENKFFVEPTYKPENAQDTIQRSCTCYFAPGSGLFSGFGKLTARMGAVEPQEIRITNSALIFRPYWRVKGIYACRYRRIHTHKLQLENDVESVTIYGKEQSVIAEKKKLSDLLASISTDVSIGYGPLKMSLSPLEGGLKTGISSILGARDRAFSTKVEMEIKDIVEIAAFNYSGAFLFDQNLGSENKDMYEVLNQQDPQPVREAQLKRQGQVFEPTITKDQVINEVKNKLYKTPEENPHKIIEHEFKITEVSLIFIPFYDLNLKYRDKTKKVRLNAMTSKVAPLS